MKRAPFRLAAGFATLLALSQAGLPAATITSVLDAYVTLPDGSWSSRFGIRDVHTGYGDWQASDFSSSPTKSASAFARTAVEQGGFKLEVRGTWHDENNVTPAASTSYAGIVYSDDIFFSQSSHTGALARVGFILDVSGSTSLNGVRNVNGDGGNVAFNIRSNPFNPVYSDTKSLVGSDFSNIPASGQVVIYQNVVLGAANLFSLVIDASGHGESTNYVYNQGTSGSYAVEYGHSVYLAGIESLTLLDGTVLTDFTATGEDGMDYRRSYKPAASVPETGSTLVALGLAFIGLAMWSRRTSR